jgi:hypothetical protein
MTRMDSRFISAVRELVQLLVACQYEEIARLTHRERLDSKSIENAIREYGRKLIMPPPEKFDQLDVVEVRNGGEPRWSVRMPLWTQEEGSSDLSIELTVIKRKNEYVVELDDIHVL